jgi:hypothetical protein
MSPVTLTDDQILGWLVVGGMTSARPPRGRSRSPSMPSAGAQAR